MAKRAVIGLTASTQSANNAGTWTDQLKQAYSRAVVKAGGVPVILPNVPGCDPEPFLDRIDGLLLSGGRDIAPALYGDEETHPTVEVDGPRDDFELPLIRAAYRRGMPILGICRGIQSLNVALGGSLWQDVPSQLPSDVKHSQDAPGAEPTHLLRLESGCRLAGVFGRAEVSVNSFHHQAVRTVAGGLRAVGWSQDGLIEAIEDPGKPFVIGLQYHPEEMVEVCEASARLFAGFAAACRSVGLR